MKRSQRFPSVALLLAACWGNACSGNAVDLGDGPLSPPPPSPTPGEVSIQCEDGIDCHDGVCASCFLETCFCDSSAEITPGGCIASGATATEPVVNDDGSAIAFAVCLQGGGCRSYYWTVAGGRQTIPGTDSDSFHPTDISGDGQLVLLSPTPVFEYGQVINTPDGLLVIPPPAVDRSTLGVRVYRVGGSVRETGLLTWLPGFSSDVAAVKLSAAGVAVGLSWAENGSQQLMRWTEEHGLEALASFPVSFNVGAIDQYGWRSEARINDVTPDGSTIVGYHGDQPLLWSDANGLQSDLSLFPAYSTFMGVSRDGTTLVGAMPDGEEGAASAFRWRRDQGVLTWLGSLDIAIATFSPDRSPTLFVSDDGSVVGGLLDRGVKGNYPFHWTQQTRIADPLVQHAAFTFPKPFLSGDGRMIGDGPNQQLYNSYARPYTVDSEPPHRFERGPISAFSHDGQATVGIGRCGGVAAVYRETVVWQE